MLSMVLKYIKIICLTGSILSAVFFGVRIWDLLDIIKEPKKQLSSQKCMEANNFNNELDCFAKFDWLSL